MRFGRIALEDAEGALLGHSVTVKKERLKKGRRLTAADIALLRRVGHADIIGARLAAGDVREDEAAERIARCLAGAHLRFAKPFTGRCNLHATSRGVALIDRSQVDAVNGIDEALTVATVAPYEVVEAGQLVATVKVIPLAVPGSLLEKCERRARAPAAVSVAALRPRPAGLVMTRLPGLKESVLDKTAATLATRLDNLGSEITRETRCAHTEEAVAEAVADLIADGCAPVLVFGASAIIDRRDVVPGAIERIGGRIERLGMPVDPGNLLLLAYRDEVPILGLPGSARSLRLNGFDYVLRCLLAGVAVSAQDLAGLGVGGLLKEMPGRPQPREPARPKPAAIAALVLAAGESRRMGRANKLTAETGGVAMVRRVVEAALASRAHPVVVVTGFQAGRIGTALAGCPVSLVHNPNYREGLSTSLAAGLAALPDGVDGALICLGDMPRITAPHLDRLIAAFDPAASQAICVPTRDGRRGNPVLWGARYFAQMRGLSGDTGARHLIDENRDAVCEIVFEDDAIFVDVDTPRALAALEAARG